MRTVLLGLVFILSCFSVVAQESTMLSKERPVP